jgi:hypothetical protein
MVDEKLNAAAFYSATTTPLKVNGRFQMTTQSLPSHEPLVIIHFSLAGMQVAGSPAKILAEYMSAFLSSDHLKYQEITFDLSTDASSYLFLCQMKEVTGMIRRQ